MIKKPLFLLLTGLLCISAQAQDYIVTLQKDTLYGEVEILLPEEFSESISFTADGDKEKYKVYEISAAFADSTTYRPVKFNNKYRLMKLIQGGYLSYYYYRADESYAFNTQYIVKLGGDGMEVPNIAFRKKMTEFLSDCPEVVTKMEDKTYRKGDLETIVAEYNACIEQRTTTKMATKPAKKLDAQEQTKIDLITNIKQKVDGNSELSTLLNDIQSKIENNQAVPSYLIGALKEQTKAIDGIQDEVEELIVKLNK